MLLSGSAAPKLPSLLAADFSQLSALSPHTNTNPPENYPAAGGSGGGGVGGGSEVAHVWQKHYT